jgi:hypothetical protein
LGTLLALGAAAPSAQARNDKLLLPIAPVLRQPGTRNLIGEDIALRFGTPVPAGFELDGPVVEARGVADPYPKHGPRYPKPDDEVCRDALRQALLELVSKARTASHNAVVGVVSNYQKVEFNSPEAYECHVGMTRAVVELKGQVARMKVAAPATVVGGHAWRLPDATDFARIDELDKLPLGEKGRERYQHYLTLPAPKAFFVYESGGWRIFQHDPEVMSNGLQQCAREGKRCWLYAVDDRVVWSADPAQRIGGVEQLRRP